MSQSSPASESFQMDQLFASCSQSIGIPASTLVLQQILRTDFAYDGLVGPPCKPRDSKDSSPAI